MIESITITNYVGDSIVLNLRHPELSGIAVKSITGLGPTKADINITEIITNDGGLFNSARIDSRNVVFNLQFLWKPTIEEVRHLTYKYFPIKTLIKMSFKTDIRETYLTGYVESNEPTIFSSEEGCQISVLCPDPFFYTSDNSASVSSSIESTFYFPFSNNHLTNKLINFGIIHSITEQVVEYEGDSEVGVEIEIHALDTATNIQVSRTNGQDGETMMINTSKISTLTGSGIVAGDTIIINTRRGNKSITLLRNGVSTNILNCLDRNTEWIKLTKGDNVFIFRASSGLSNLTFTINYNIVYEGL